MSKYRMHLLALLGTAMWAVIIVSEWNAQYPAYDGPPMPARGEVPPLPPPIEIGYGRFWVAPDSNAYERL